MKRKLALLLSIMMVLTCFMFAACGNKEAAGGDDSEAVETFDGTMFGYDGDDWMEYAAYQYMAETIGPQYDRPEGAISLPIVRIIDTEVDSEDGDAEVYGDFWVFNYVIEGDTMKCVSGGAHPGKMELIQVGSGYAAKDLEVVKDGEAYMDSAKDIFEERYDDFEKISSDETGREELRAKGIATYVKVNNLPVTKYQDEGWDPVDLPL